MQLEDFEASFLCCLLLCETMACSCHCCAIVAAFAAQTVPLLPLSIQGYGIFCLFSFPLREVNRSFLGCPLSYGQGECLCKREVQLLHKNVK